MSEIIYEFINTKRKDIRIDRENGVLYGVKILGRTSRNGREYPSSTLQEAIVLYENAKVNLDHPDGDPRKPRSYQDRFGMIRNVELRENDGLFAELRFNPKHPLAEQLLWDAEHAPENVGFSHNVEAIVRRADDRQIIDKIVSVRSVDLVADPATTTGLFESTTENVQDEVSGTEPSFNLPVNEGESDIMSTVQNQNRDENHTGLLRLCESLLRSLRADVPILESLVDDTFLETLRLTQDESLLERLVDDRIRLLELFQAQRKQQTSQQTPPTISVTESRPVARQQYVAEPEMNAETFAKLILR